MAEPAKQEDTPSIDLRTDPQSGRQVIVPAGDWILSQISAVEQTWRAIETRAQESRSGVQLSQQEAVIDGGAITALDAAGALLIAKLAGCGNSGGDGRPELRNFSAPHRKIIELVSQGKFDCGGLKLKNKLGPLQNIGKGLFDAVSVCARILRFVGQAASESLVAVSNPRSFRVREFFVQLEAVLVDAVPIVSLVTFLIGIVVAYLFAIQVERYGGSIFIVEAVGIAMLRELSPILVAIIMAGRSGSAFTAQLGVMKINEEVDALTILGLSPFQVLIIPRLAALVIAMPLLAFVGDVVGVFGAMIIAETRLGISMPMFAERLGTMVAVRHLYIGLIKAPVFAAFIAIIGCNMGLAVENNARSVGSNTTATVVQSIVAVILLNAAFAVMFVKMGY